MKNVEQQNGIAAFRFEPESRGQRGVLRFGPGHPPVYAPRSATVHHRNKRRGLRLLDEREWLAVSWAGHRAIETQKHWARERGYLRKF